MSKRIRKIRDDFFKLHEKTQEAFEKGDREVFKKYQKEFISYCCQFQKELKIPDEKIEDLREGLGKAEVVDAEINYLKAKIERIKGEAEKEKKQLSEALANDEKNKRIKWQ